MPLKSKKSKSKRSTLKHKYKVIKKVKQHLKKKAKEAKRSGRKPKAPKDPGIPAAWPFKEELMKDLEFQKQRILAKEKARKEERKAARAAVTAAPVDEDMQTDEQMSVKAVQEDALRKQEAFVSRKRSRLAKPSAADDKDGSKRAFYKEFVKVVSAADVIVEVLDARDPLGCRCLDIERFVRRAGSDKKIILLLNKIDLVPREVAEAWLKYLREELPTVAFKSSTQKQATNLKQGRLPKAATPSAALQGSDSLGADTLLQLLKNYTRNAGIKTAITVGIVGLPNVGKSSLINSLKRARVAQVGNAPGVTRSMQEISLDKSVKLLDSPGIVFSSAQPGDAYGALRNCIKVEQLEDPQAAVAEILKRCPAKQLMSLYKVPAYKDTDEFLQHVAFQRGKLLPGGVGDPRSAARVVLHDWHNGKIAYYTTPPKRGDGSHEEAAVLSNWGQDFDAEKVFANERNAVIAELPSLEDESQTFFPTESAGAAAVNLADMDAPSSDKDSDADDDDDEVGLEEEKGGNALQAAAGKGAVQTPKLYDAPGQYNPLAARADRKRQKKLKATSGNDDFNFAEAFAEAVQVDEDDDDEDGSDDMSEGDFPEGLEEE